MAVQASLPGFGRVKTARRRPSYTRVRSDPAVVASEGVSEGRFHDWRQSFARFVSRLPDERREELRQRIAGINAPRVIRSREVDAA